MKKSERNSLEIDYEELIREKDIQIQHYQDEYYRVRFSLSYRVGMALTYWPRKLRRILSSLVHIAIGYRLYARILKLYGVDVQVLYTVPFGTGDYYICGLYLKEWSDSLNHQNYVFLVPAKGGERRVTELFSSYTGHMYECVKHWRDICSLNAFNTLYNDPEPLVHYLHHREPAFKNNSFRLTYDRIQGYKGWNMVDFYLLYGYGIQLDSRKDDPCFKRINTEELLSQKGLISGRTAVLAPNSSGLSEYSPEDSFWVDLRDILIGYGYTVATNCFGDEEPVEGTVPFQIKYQESVPILEACGLFIGIRSGLCDIVSTAKCKKIIIHTYRAQFWPIGESISYTGLNNMGLCDDAIELEYNDEYGYADLLEQIKEELGEMKTSERLGN